MKSWQIIIIGVFTGFLAAGITLLVSMQPVKQEIRVIPPTAATTLMIDIEGQVNSPGLLTLPVNSRVQDAIVMAKGLKEDADTSNINLADFLQDGQKITIPQAGTPQSNLTLSSEDKIDLNHASLEELDTLPGIGPQKAQDIINYRENYGPFSQIEDLLYVSGIGQSLLESIRDKLIITP